MVHYVAAWHARFGDIIPGLFRRCQRAWGTVETVLCDGTKDAEPFTKIYDSLRPGASRLRCQSVAVKFGEVWQQYIAENWRENRELLDLAQITDSFSTQIYLRVMDYWVVQYSQTDTNNNHNNTNKHTTNNERQTTNN